MPIEGQTRISPKETVESLLPWEVGGFFQHCELSYRESIRWPQPHVFFALARHVVAGILRVNTSIRRVWIPEYFCPEITQYWSEIIQTATYCDEPTREEPVWESLRPDKHDLVIAMNYFGVRAADSWERWRSCHNCILIEDHTHDPLSSWAQNSSADYVFSSLRKSMPITEGAICWSPRGLRLPVPQGRINDVAIDLKLAAMIEKADFLSGKASHESKSRYRELYARGDKYLEDGPEAPISDGALDYVHSGVPAGWRKVRERNVRNLLSSLKELRIATPLFVQWPVNSVPFAVVLVFTCATDRDNCRSYLERNNVFCPIHWNTLRSPCASELSNRILSIPADQRYGDEDMARIAKILNRWDLSKPADNYMRSNERQ